MTRVCPSFSDARVSDTIRYAELKIKPFAWCGGSTPEGDAFLRALKGRCVLTGKPFRLSKPTVAVQLDHGTPTIVTIPTDAVIAVRSGPDANGKVMDKGIVYARWEDRSIALFAVDIEARGVEVLETSHRFSSAA